MGHIEGDVHAENIERSGDEKKGEHRERTETGLGK